MTYLAFHLIAAAILYFALLIVLKVRDGNLSQWSLTRSVALIVIAPLALLSVTAHYVVDVLAFVERITDAMLEAYFNEIG